MADRGRDRLGHHRLLRALALALSLDTIVAAVLASGAEPPGDPEVRLWQLRETARRLDLERDFAAADAAYAEAVQAFVLWGRSREGAEALTDWAQSLDRRRRWDEAIERLARAEQLLGPASGVELTLARVLHLRGECLRHRDDYPGAEAYHRRALALRERCAPGGLDTAESLYGLGRVLSESGRGSPLPWLERAEAILRHLDPGSREHGYVLSFLGWALMATDEEQAERHQREALRIALRRDPQGYLEALARSRLGAVRRYRGDLLSAQDELRAAMSIVERLPSDFLPLSLAAGTARRLSRVNLDLGDWEEGLRLARQAVELQRSFNPHSLPMATAQASLGQAARLLERNGEAEGCYRQSLALLEELVPQSSSIPIVLSMLARLAVDGGRVVEAGRLLARARPTFERLYAGTRSFADLLSIEGRVAGRSGRLAEAIERHREALALFDRLDPESFERVEVLGALAFWERRAGRFADSKWHACRAASLVALQGTRLVGDEEARRKLSRGYSEYSAQCAESLVEEGQPAEAFRVVEAARARALLQVMSLREADLLRVPEPLRLRRQELRQGEEKLAARLERVGEGGGGAERRELSRERADNRRRQHDLARQIEREAGLGPGSAPHSVLDLDRARAALDPGTRLLEYVVGDSRALLFVVRAAGEGGPAVSVRRLAVERKELEARVQAYRQLLADPLSESGAIARAGSDLYARLVEPAEGELAGAARLLIVPDGPLHALPFAALRRQDGTTLVERWPLHSTLSVSVYAELRKRRRDAKPEDLRLAAFGEPLDLRPAGEALVLPAGIRGADPLRVERFAPLPQSRREVGALRELFPSARILTGPDATEREARALSPGFDLIHFAVHARLDAERPARSALVLSLPREKAREDGDGFFEAAEIRSTLHLNASLVTLSACETALGREMGGEGLVGLAQAFQEAGARSVLASLWSIADRPTARLMPLFYAELRAGKPKDEALRAAQLALLRDPATAHPANWAGLVLIGDSR